MRLIVPLLLLATTPMVAGCDRQKTEAPQAPASDPEAGKGLDRSHNGARAPDVPLIDRNGKKSRLLDGPPHPVLVNLWASWCAPCIKELPTLERLEESMGDGAPIWVYTVNQDMAPRSSVDAFLKDKGLKPTIFYDPDMALSSALGVQIMPTTILYDAHGKEVWRYVGDLDWTSEEAKKLLNEVLSPPGKA